MKGTMHEKIRSETDPGSDPTFRQTTKNDGAGKPSGGTPSTQESKQTGSKKMSIMRQPKDPYDQITKNG